MALLTVATRKKHFKTLGFGEYNKANILKMQKKYMLRPSDWDGIYGKNSDALLRHLINCRHAPNFAPEEFVCGCGGKYCSGYPTRMKVKTLDHIQSIRNHFGKPVIVTSALRCSKYNKLVRGLDDSLHKSGYAVDFYINGYTDLSGRKRIINYAKTLKNHHYSYCDGYNSYGSKTISAPGMDVAVHTDVK